MNDLKEDVLDLLVVALYALLIIALPVSSILGAYVDFPR